MTDKQIMKSLTELLEEYRDLKNLQCADESNGMMLSAQENELEAGKTFEELYKRLLEVEKVCGLPPKGLFG